MAGGIVWPTSSSELTRLSERKIGNPSSDSSRFDLKVVSARLRELQRPLRVFLVDDEDIYLSSVEALTRQGDLPAERIAFITAQSLAGSRAVCAENEPFDVAILDLDLGEDGPAGLELIEEVRRYSPKAVICLHSNRDPVSLFRQAVERGADLCLPKPLSLEHLGRLLLTALETKGDGEVAKPVLKQATPLVPVNLH
jgi:DNA-binding NtrC family response regulator